MNSNDVLDMLIDGMPVEILKDSSVLTNTEVKASVPVEVINCMLGGGAPMNCIIHSFGTPSGGKSTLLYQMMAKFQKDYPDGISIIVDTEASTDPIRCKALGVDVEKVIRYPATSIESGFLTIMEIIKKANNNKELKDIPIFMIWDTISRGLPQEGTTISRMLAQDRARIIKQYLPELQKTVGSRPYILALINQVVNRADRYGNNHEEFGGGIALGHDMQLNFYLKSGTKVMDDQFEVGKWSSVNIIKSKISPELFSIPIYIDTTKGGLIDEVSSFVKYLVDNLKLITQSVGWYVFDNLVSYLEDNGYVDLVNKIKPYMKKYRWNDLVGLFESNKLIFNICKVAVMHKFSSLYTLQAIIIKPYMDKVLLEISNYKEGEEIIEEEGNSQQESDEKKEEE